MYEFGSENDCFWFLQKAKIRETASHGNVLDLTTTGATVDLGSYQGKQNPFELCHVHYVLFILNNLLSYSWL